MVLKKSCHSESDVFSWWYVATHIRLPLYFWASYTFSIVNPYYTYHVRGFRYCAKGSGHRPKLFTWGWIDRSHNIHNVRIYCQFLFETLRPWYWLSSWHEVYMASLSFNVIIILDTLKRIRDIWRVSWVIARLISFKGWFQIRNLILVDRFSVVRFKIFAQAVTVPITKGFRKTAYFFHQRSGIQVFVSLVRILWSNSYLLSPHNLKTWLGWKIYFIMYRL